MITQIYCSRSKEPHRIGHVSADSVGMVLTYFAAVLSSPTDAESVVSQDGLRYRAKGVQSEERLHTDEALKLDPEAAAVHIDLWCKSCKTGHPIALRAIAQAAQHRQRNITLSSRGRWEGLWR